ncbi:MAG: hypothetical protein IPK71_29505 [Myxococcales bacterium]|nr:hypothetical protein [Myxococcales bacterium]
MSTLDFVDVGDLPRVIEHVADEANHAGKVASFGHAAGRDAEVLEVEGAAPRTVTWT